MAQIELRITDAQLQAALTEVATQAGDLSSAMKDIGEYLLRKTRKRFNTQTAPDGTSWAPLAPSTIKAKQRRQRTGKPYRTNANPESILKDTFTLRDSITYQASNRSLAIGTNIAYGVYPQSDRPRTKIPYRPFLGLDDADRSEIIEIIRDHLLQP
jgi:phage virion morphogenesis protein